MASSNYTPSKSTVTSLLRGYSPIKVGGYSQSAGYKTLTRSTVPTNTYKTTGIGCAGCGSKSSVNTYRGR